MRAAVGGLLTPTPDVSAYYGSQVRDSVALCEYLLEEAKVACVPGAGFGTYEHMPAFLRYVTGPA